MELMVARVITVVTDLVEEAVENDLEAEAVETKDKVSEAEVVSVTLYKEDIMETEGSNLMLTFPASQTIFTLKILHLMTTNGMINSSKNREMQS